MKLEERVLKTIEVLVNAKKLMYDSFCMIFTKSSVKFSLISRNKFLSRVRFYFWRLAIIELAKILSTSKNENYRITKLISDIITNYDDIAWKNPLSKQELKEMMLKLESNEVASKVKDLIELRNQHYAHTDISPKRNEYEVELYYTQLESLINLSEEILSRIAYSLYDKNDLVTNYTGEDVNDFIDEVLNDREELGGLRLKLK